MSPRASKVSKVSKVSNDERPRIFIGDVQGCADELERLVAKARDRFGSDVEFWLVGDLINRGPASLEVLEFVWELEDRGCARVVLGNHELALLQCWFGLRSPGERDTTAEILEANDAAEWIDWIRRWRVVEQGSIGGDEFVMVHASVHPDWTLAEVSKRARRIEALLSHEDADVCQSLVQRVLEGGSDRDADELGRFTRCRSVTDGGAHWSSAVPESARLGSDARSQRSGNASVPWHQEWARRRHSYGVVYGHWALQRLHVAPGLRGLDTGCVHHGRGHEGFLTAWFGAASPRKKLAAFDVPDDRFLQQKARRRYYEFD